jgi:SAM-dependent methyltransferase
VHAVGHDVGSYSRRLSQEDGFEILGWDDLNKAPDRFDIITCIEVIEHVADPAPVVRLLAHCLKPGGLLILTTGNLDCLLAKVQGIHFAYCIPEIHISLFNPSLLRKLYRENGLTPVTFRYKGMVKFRVLKTLRLFSSGTSLNWVANLPSVLRLLDWIFGVSAMPCAVKPSSGRKG